MKLQIVEQFWAVEAPTRITNKVLVPLTLGRVPGMERWSMFFTIDTITDDAVEVTVHYKDEKYNQTWTVTADRGIYYRPISMDGGYEYYLDLKRK